MTGYDRDELRRQLRYAERKYQAAAKTADEKRVLRNYFVRCAIEDGWTHAQIAEATGMTRARVGQIAQG